MTPEETGKRPTAAYSTGEKTGGPREDWVKRAALSSKKSYCLEEK